MGALKTNLEGGGFKGVVKGVGLEGIELEGAEEAELEDGLK